jgi:hypothetical protein
VRIPKSREPDCSSIQKKRSAEAPHEKDCRYAALGSTIAAFTWSGESGSVIGCAVTSTPRIASRLALIAVSFLISLSLPEIILTNGLRVRSRRW